MGMGTDGHHLHLLLQPGAPGHTESRPGPLSEGGRLLCSSLLCCSGVTPAVQWVENANERNHDLILLVFALPECLEVPNWRSRI